MNQGTRKIIMVTVISSILAMGSTDALAITPWDPGVPSTGSVEPSTSPSREEGRKAGYRTGYPEGAQRARKVRCMVVEVDPPSGTLPVGMEGDPYWTEGYLEGYPQGFGAGFLSACPAGPLLAP